jgi:VIT1/CCC1 family predicted Fe2+/Mn2+ transporter
VGSAGLLDRILARFATRHELRVRPHAGPVPEGERPPGLGGKSGALRAAIFGVNDGLVSNLALIMGVTGGAVPNRVILLAGVAGLLAGAFSMAGGEYLSMRVQRELFERLIHLEAHELGTDPEEERRELQRIYESRGFPPELAREVSEALMRDPAVALETHAREELGLDPAQLGSPWGAALSSFPTFAAGAAVPLVPFVVGSGLAAAVAAAAASGVALFAVGASLSLLTGRSPWASGLRMLLVGGSLAGLTFGVGRALHVGVAP